MDIVLLLLIIAASVVFGYLLGRYAVRREIVEQTILPTDPTAFEQVAEKAEKQFKKFKERRGQ